MLLYIIDRRKVGIEMIKPIMKDVLFLAQKSEEATKDDLYIVDDLIDTLRANLDDKNHPIIKGIIDYLSL